MSSAPGRTVNHAPAHRLPPPVGALLLAVVTAVVAAVATAAAVAADRAGGAALAGLAPLVDAAARGGADLLARAHVVLPAAAVVTAALAVGVAMAIAVGRGWGPSAALWAMTGAAFAAQAAWLVGRPWTGVAAAALLLPIALAGRSRAPGDDPLHVPGPSPLAVSDVALLAAPIAVAVVMRFYALNRVPRIFEGELSPFSLGATDWWGMWLANAGAGGPWAPLGMLYYLPIRLAVEVAGPTVLAIRLGSAVVSVATVAVGAVLARELAGRWAAVLAAFLLALDPLQVGWGRTDVHPHGSTAWPALLLAYATLRMLRTGATRWFAAVAALMAVTWHQYPSGQFAVLVPVVTLLAATVLDRRRVAGWGWRPVLVAVGLGGWVLGFPLTERIATGRWVGFADYMRRLGPRMEGQAGVESVVAYLGHVVHAAWELAVGIWVGVPRLFHQTFLPETPHLAVRALPWAVAALALVGLVALAVRPRRESTWVLLALVATSTAPAVMSDLAYVKRASVLYPTLEIVAAVVVAALVRAASVDRPRVARSVLTTVAAVTIALWAATACHLWFSGERYPWGRPAEEVIADAVAAEMGPGDLVVASFWDHYMDGKLTYLLSDRLRDDEPPPVWLVTRPDGPAWPRVATDPAAAVAGAPSRRWVVTWAGLDPTPRWTSGRAVYLLEAHDDVDGQLAAVRSACPGSRATLLEPEAAEPKHVMWLVVCDAHPGARRATGDVSRPAG